MSALEEGVSTALELDRDGAELIAGAVGEATLLRIEATIADLSGERAGTRLHGRPGLAEPLSANGAVGRLAAARLGEGARPVRALLFDKNATNNWALGWHQDRTIVVRERVEVDGFGPWSVKAGLQHCAPPIGLLARMLTVRLHLDDVGEDNAPLLVAPGSHRRGRVPEREIKAVVAECGTATCLARRGDVWLYATPILHASNVAVSPRRRRVLQVDCSACELPGGLEWLGV